MMKTAVALILAFGLAACGPRLSVHADNPRSPKAAVQAWSDAFNEDRLDALGALVHPRQRSAFKKNRSTMRKRLQTWTISRYRLGQTQRINNEFAGQQVELVLHDGRRELIVEGMVAETKGRWWLWTY